MNNISKADILQAAQPLIKALQKQKPTLLSQNGSETTFKVGSQNITVSRLEKKNKPTNTSRFR